MLGAVLRVRLKSPIHYLPFVYWTFRVIDQLDDTDGFLGGQTLIDRRMAFWVQSLWVDRQAMNAFYRSGTHKEVMPLVAKWCDEATTVEWESDNAEMKSFAEVHRLMGEKARMSKVQSPSENQLKRIIAPPAAPNRFNTRVLAPKS